MEETNPRRVKPRCGLGVVLEGARIKKGVSVKALVAELGITRTYWYALLSGKRRPHKVLLRLFASELGLSYTDLHEIVFGPPDNRDIWAGRTYQDAEDPGALTEPNVVYLLFDRDERLIYIGSSGHLRQRLMHHRPKGYHGWVAYRCASSLAAYAYERELLDKHRPPLNDSEEWELGVPGIPWNGPLPSQLIQEKQKAREEPEHEQPDTPDHHGARDRDRTGELADTGQDPRRSAPAPGAVTGLAPVGVPGHGSPRGEG